MLHVRDRAYRKSVHTVSSKPTVGDRYKKIELKMPFMCDHAYGKSGPKWSASARVPVRKMIGCSLVKANGLISLVKANGRSTASSVGGSMNRQGHASPAFGKRKA